MAELDKDSKNPIESPSTMKMIKEAISTLLKLYGLEDSQLVDQIIMLIQKHKLEGNDINIDDILEQFQYVSIHDSESGEPKAQGKKRMSSNENYGIEGPSKMAAISTQNSSGPIEKPNHLHQQKQQQLQDQQLTKLVALIAKAGLEDQNKDSASDESTEESKLSSSSAEEEEAKNVEMTSVNSSSLIQQHSQESSSLLHNSTGPSDSTNSETTIALAQDVSGSGSVIVQWYWQSNKNPDSEIEPVEWTPYNTLQTLTIETCYLENKKIADITPYLVDTMLMRQVYKEDTFRVRRVKREVTKNPIVS